MARLARVGFHAAVRIVAGNAPELIAGALLARALGELLDVNDEIIGQAHGQPIRFVEAL